MILKKLQFQSWNYKKLKKCFIKLSLTNFKSYSDLIKMPTKIISPFALKSNFPYHIINTDIINAGKKPFKATPKLAYINERIINCRLTGLYKALNKRDYDRTSDLIADTINMIKIAEVVDIDAPLYSKINDDFYRIAVDFAFKLYHSVHNRIRDMHYYIINYGNPF